MASSSSLETGLEDEPRYLHQVPLGFAGEPVEPTPELAQIHSTIDQLQSDGRPFFSRENLERISRALSEPRGGARTIPVGAIDGSSVDFEYLVGTTQPHHEPGLEYIVTKPYLLYRSFETLVSPEWNADLRTAYCSILLTHQMRICDAMTKQSLRWNPIVPLEESMRMFDDIRREWEGSEACGRFRMILRTSTLRLDVRKVVGLALGTICQTRSALGMLLARNSALQHAMVLTIRDVFRDRTDEADRDGPNDPIRLYVQDPVYTASAGSLLSRYGMAVLEDPLGFLEIGDTTAVISCGPDIPVKQIVADLARPALLIWTTVQPPEKMKISTDPDSARVRTMMDAYERFDFPGEWDAFAGLSIYVR